MKRNIRLAGLLLSSIVVLGCAGMGSEEPADAPVAPSADERAKLKVGKSKAEKQAKRDKRPTGARMESVERRDEYVVKLTAECAPQDLRQGLKTGNKKLDGDLDGLSLEGAEGVHARHAPKNQAAADELGLGRTIHIKTKKPKDVVISKLEAHECVEWVEPVTSMESASTPNDPYYKYQWHLAQLNIPKAWAITKGEGVVVAVVDTGVSVNEDGFHKLVKGYDFVDNDDRPDDANGHGTHVAGTIAQASNNGKGVAGVAPMASIMPIRVLDANGSGSNTSVANGIIWAVDHGANIINLSLGSPTNSDVVEDACAYAYENGVTVIAATGNDGFTDYIGYPAALPTTIAVGSVDATKTVAFYSNQGKQIDLVAPGGDTTGDADGDGMQDGVLQETILGGVWAYHYLQGTSMATPHVAGAAALLYANGVRDPDGIREALTSTARDLGEKGWDSAYGSGLLDPVAALAVKGGKGDKGSKGGKNGGGGDLKITKHRVEQKSDQRAVIAWMTNEPAGTMVRGENGFEKKSATPTKVHKVTVQGKKGETVEFTYGSKAGDDKAMDKVSVTF
jgi:subtilisin family serine protease